MTRRLVVAFLAIVAVVLVALELPLGASYARTAEERLFTAAERDAGVIAAVVEEDLEDGLPVTDLPQPLVDYVGVTGSRVLVTDRFGISVADTDPPTPGPRDYSTRPEIAAALRGERASGTRDSATVGEPLAYVAVPVLGGGRVLGSVRLTLPRSDIDRAIRDYWLRLGLLALGVLALTTGVGVTLARWISRPLSEVVDAVGRIAGGDLAVRAPADRGPPEVRVLADEVNTMAARLQTLIGSQTAFVADASHQLRSPLAALRLELDNLREGLDGPSRASVERAGDEVRRLARSVDGLLALSRAERAQPAVVDVDVAALVADRAAIWSDVAEETGCHVRLREPTAHPAGVAAAAVADHVEQILDNLLDNALRFTPAGETVEVAYTPRDDGTVTIEVTDRGPGLDEEARGRAFERFWRGGGQHPDSGTGLGLPIARRLARSMGGEVTLAPAPAGGTTATLRLRRARDPGPV